MDPYDPTVPPPIQPTDIQTTLADILIAEAAVVVVSYVVEKPYTWPRKPYTAGILITGNKILSRANLYATPKRWIRIVATESVAECAHRWRMLIEFGPTSLVFGSVAFGGTKAPAGITAVGLTDWPNAATIDDVLVSTGESSKNLKLESHILTDGKAFGTGFIRSTAKTAVSTVQFDPMQQTMTVGFRCYDDILRSIVVALPDSDTAWRPCVTVLDAVTATILSWPDD